MELIDDIIQHIQSVEDPTIYYIGIAIAIIGVAIIVRSLLVLLITYSIIAIVIAVCLMLTGKSLPGITLPENFDLQKLIPESWKTDDGSAPEDSEDLPPPPTASPQPQKPDPLAESLAQKRQERRNQRDFRSPNRSVAPDGIEDIIDPPSF